MVILGFGVDAVGGAVCWGAAVGVGVDGGIDKGEGVCEVFGAARKGLVPAGKPLPGKRFKVARAIARAQGGRSVLGGLPCQTA